MEPQSSNEETLDSMPHLDIYTLTALGQSVKAHGDIRHVRAYKHILQDVSRLCDTPDVLYAVIDGLDAWELDYAARCSPSGAPACSAPVPCPPPAASSTSQPPAASSTLPPAASSTLLPAASSPCPPPAAPLPVEVNAQIRVDGQLAGLFVRLLRDVVVPSIAAKKYYWSHVRKVLGDKLIIPVYYGDSVFSHIVVGILAELDEEKVRQNCKNHALRFLNTKNGRRYDADPTNDECARCMAVAESLRPLIDLMQHSHLP